MITMASEPTATSTTTPTTANSSSTAIYYFGYGPIVNPNVRIRRGLTTIEERPAILPEFRLTFAYGGIANIIRQRGYEVHGILMKFTSEDDWKHFQTYDAGYNVSDLVTVFPYDSDQENRDDNEPITAYAMSMNEYDATKLEAPIEQLPTERYLKLIADGMQAYHVDDDYIQDQILSVPYVPSRKPEDYRSFPRASEKLPAITVAKYQRLCQRTKNDIYFIMNRKVCRLVPHDPQHPAVLWTRERLHGHCRDATLIIHQTILEPNLIIVDTEEDLTPLHHAWAENLALEFLQKCNLTVTKVYDLVVPDTETMRTTTVNLGGALSRLCCFAVSNQQRGGGGGGSVPQDQLPPLASSSWSRRRSTRGRGHPETLVSSELLQREIRRNAGDGGETDAEEESASQ